MMNRSLGVVALVAVGLVGCGQSKPKQVAKDTLTTRQRQEREAAMPIPGAQGIGKALKIQDSGAARAQAIDSIAGER